MATQRSLAIVALGQGVVQPVQRKGGFRTIQYLSLPAGDASDPQAARLAAARLARQAGADWTIVLNPGDALAEDALDLVAPALDLFDAVFGSVHVQGTSDAVARLSRLDFDTADRLPHALLNWWLPQSHLVRSEVAVAVLERVAARKAENPSIDYLFDLWSAARCLKSAQPMLVVKQEPEPLAQSERNDVLRRLAEKPVFLPVVHGDAVYQLPYTGRNAGIEREQTRGLFFEAMELEELRKVIRPGARIVDVGANTGNHTVFFAGPMKAATVVPIEPLPEAMAALRASVAVNRLANVDLSRLGVGVGDRPGRARLVFSAKGGFGATSLEADPEGDVVVATLDSMISEAVDFLKIDVEGMEMSVLAGAASLIARCRPRIFIEIANRNTPAFTSWLDDNGYVVARIFTDKGHANYLIEPKGAS